MQGAGGSEQTSYRWRKEYGGLHLSRHHVWADDFGAERTHAGRPVKILAGVDEYSRECLALVVARQSHREFDMTFKPGRRHKLRVNFMPMHYRQSGV